MALHQDATEASSLHLPRILCLHGGGTNAEIFWMQCRNLRAQLASRFRFVFVDGPFLSHPHPDIITVYGSYGPFRRWLRWETQHEPVDDQMAVGEIMHVVRSAMQDDDGEIARAGISSTNGGSTNGTGASHQAYNNGTREEEEKEEEKEEESQVRAGPWVGVLGFSQGAKVAASLLLYQQRARAAGEEHPLGDGVDLKFGVLMAGRGPLVDLSEGRLPKVRGLSDAGQIGGEFKDWPEPTDTAHLVMAPTLHVHGLRDPGHELHVKLAQLYCKEETARVLEWDGGHRVVIKTTDVDRVAKAILETAEGKK